MSDSTIVTTELADYKDIKDLSQLRLTPTGKISYAKSRVYTQRYRKDWEQQPDFQGWLTSIPDSPTRAYCLYCKKDLHAHRLSLLKHTCTMKHQRAALNAKANADMQAIYSINLKYAEAENEGDDKSHYTNIEYLDGAFQPQERIEEMEYEPRNDESFEEVEDETSIVDVDAEQNKEVQKDVLAKVMEQINVENEEEDEQQHQESIQVLIGYNPEESAENAVQSEAIVDRKPTILTQCNEMMNENDVINKLGDDVIIIKKQSQTARKSMKKTLANERAVTVTQSSTLTLPETKVDVDTKYLLNPHFNTKNTQNTTKKEAKENHKYVVQKKTPQNKSNILSKKSRITTHVIDTTKGVPVSGLQVSLYKLVDGRWTFINESSTLVNGYCIDLLDHEKTNFTTGRYKLHFDVDKYFTCRKIETMYPFIEIVFDVKNVANCYHMPMLLSPFGYTIHRGFEK